MMKSRSVLVRVYVTYYVSKHMNIIKYESDKGDNNKGRHHQSHDGVHSSKVGSLYFVYAVTDDNVYNMVLGLKA